MERVFLYETLRNLSTLSHVLGEEPEHEKVQALNLKKVPSSFDKTYFTLEFKKNHLTDGLLVEISEKELKVLDAWEEKYSRKNITLKDGSKAWAYVLKDSNMRKSFLEKLIDLNKGGPGSGVKGHHTDRKPFPGEEQHKFEVEPVQNMSTRRQTYIPPEGTQHHYSDTPNMRAYKNIIRGFKQMGMDFQGHLTYDPKSDEIKTLTPKAKEVVDKLIADVKAKKEG